MDEEQDRDKYSQLTGMLDRLWNKAFPTQGSVKSRSRRDNPPPLEPLPAPQENMRQIKESTEILPDSSQSHNP